MCDEQSFVRSAALGCIKGPSGAGKTEIPANNKVWALDRATLEPVYSWGTGGGQPGQFDWLHYMDFDSQGNLYTGEVQTGHRLQKFVRLNGN